MKKTKPSARKKRLVLKKTTVRDLAVQSKHQNTVKGGGGRTASL